MLQLVNQLLRTSETNVYKEFFFHNCKKSTNFLQSIKRARYKENETCNNFTWKVGLFQMTQERSFETKGKYTRITLDEYDDISVRKSNVGHSIRLWDTKQRNVSGPGCESYLPSIWSLWWCVTKTSSFLGKAAIISLSWWSKHQRVEMS